MQYLKVEKKQSRNRLDFWSVSVTLNVMSWVPLNVHSQYSLLDSTASIQGLVDRCKSFNIKSLAITDTGNLYGAVDFFKACKAAGIKPILGCEIWIAPGRLSDKKRVVGVPSGYPILLLAKDEIGFQNLCRLSSIGFLEGFYYQPRIDKERLLAHKEGLICLSGPIDGPIGQAILHPAQSGADISEAKWYLDCFGADFFLQIERHVFAEGAYDGESWLKQKAEERQTQEGMVNRRLVEIAKELHIPLVATHDIHYLDPQNWQAHEVLLNVQSGEPIEIWERDSRGNPKSRLPNPKREVALARDLYFKSPEEIALLFADLPEAVEATEIIAKRCGVLLDFKAKHYPVFIPPSLEGQSFTKKERLQEAEAYLYSLAQAAIPVRYTGEKLAAVGAKYPGQDPMQVVLDRFAYEFQILSSKGMCDYMLIVYDFIAWAKKRGIPMGPGRGSAAGSIISYLIGITDIEPLRFNLFFERFINPERVSYPDIDVDICMDRRQEVIDYVVAKYGKDKVAQIITFGTMKAKMAIRDVGRVLNIALSKVNEIAALVPEDPTMTLEGAFQIDPTFARLRQEDPEVGRLLDMALLAEGSIRNTSTHAAGLIISASAITDLIPVCTAKDSDMVVTQYAMKQVEMVGMLKIDFLGLKTLTSIQACVDAIADSKGKRIDWINLPLDDIKTYALLNHGKTLGVFQLESGGMQELAKQLHIDTFEEIIAVGALYRPGPMDMIPSFIARKHGKEAIEIDHPLIHDILAETYGVMVYQEQVMQIASVLAGYSLGEGDVLRRAMGKKDKEEMARQREKFLSGAAQKGIEAAIAERIFDKIEKFASYGFNKSHAAAYGYLSYATAYFKANYPGEWMASLMTCDRDDTTKVAKFISEAKAMHISVLPPDINVAGRSFVVADGGIRFAMSGIKGVGTNVVEAILEERKRGGSFSSLYEFIQRIDKSRIGKKQVELLVEAGAFDFTRWSRDAMRLSIEAMFDEANSKETDEKLGVLNLFSLIEEPTKPFAAPPSVPQPTTPMQRLIREKELLGLYVTGHPMDQFRHLFPRLSCVPFAQFGNLPDATVVRSAFVIDTVVIKVSSKSQRKFAILHVSDGEERIELPIWSDLYEEKIAFIKEGALLYSVIQIERKEGALHLSCKHIEALEVLNEAKITEVDNVYERLKMQAHARATEPKWKRNAVSEEESSAIVALEINVQTVQMSEILALKDLFRSHPGKTAVQIRFHDGIRKVATVSIDSKWGVKLGAAFKDKIDLLVKERAYRVEYTTST
ncbi:MAG: polymerase subunit alpha [Chlamydiota bacterium]|jgi:DNA polymerase-3 subunit alpha